MVAVPEVPDDPTVFPRVSSDAGYFEGLAVTDDDRARGGQYQENLQRESLRSSATDVPTYLRGLGMKLEWRRFDRTGLSRTAQLINKTNQFNLTTRRYTGGRRPGGDARQGARSACNCGCPTGSATTASSPS
jgi:FkbH-like protein